MGGQTLTFTKNNAQVNNGAGGGFQTLGTANGNTTNPITTGAAGSVANFNVLLNNDAWAGGATENVNSQFITLNALTISQTYAFDIFAYDGRSVISSTRTEQFGDAQAPAGNYSASASTYKPVSFIGTFTATATTEKFYSLGTTPSTTTYDTTISAISLYAVPEPSTLALIALSTMSLLIWRRRSMRA